MENGGLDHKFSGLAIDDGKDNSLIQVMKAVEAAAATIKQQDEENNRLRAELQKKELELESIKLDNPAAQRSLLNEQSDEHGQAVFKAHRVASMLGSRDSAGLTQLSSVSTAAFSRGRQPIDGEYAEGLIPVAETNNSVSLWKQDLVQKIREHEEEIRMLRKQLAEYSIKEAQIRNEKYVLEKRIAHMRMTFDQQQQDLVDAASKALSYRQDIIEENVRLTYQLQDAQQERTTFVSYLLPLLADYSMQPPVLDAQSIVSSVKVLFKHLQEKLIFTEAKLRESQYQLVPWRSEENNSNFAPQSPQQSSGAALSSSKNGLELVPQSTYSPVHVATDVWTNDRNVGGLNARPGGNAGAFDKNMELDDFGRSSPNGRRNNAAHDASTQVSFGQEALYAQHYHGDSFNRCVKFKDPVSSSSIDELDGVGHSSGKEHPMNWGPGTPSNTSAVDEPASSYSPYLQTVPEDPSSSFSEAADDDPLPAIDGLQISGEAYPGQFLQACGVQTNGTTCCNFEWVRHLEDGSINYIEGAKQPSYLVCADDVDTYLAIEVQPLDDRKRKGELVKVFANDHKKITAHPTMQSHIEKNFYSGHASYVVSVSTDYPEVWEPATLLIKRESFSINCKGPIAVENEKLVPPTTASISYEHPSEFSIMDGNGNVYMFRAVGSAQDVNSSRDTIVLTFRWFLKKAGEKKKRPKGKKRNLFGF